MDPVIFPTVALVAGTAIWAKISSISSQKRWKVIERIWEDAAEELDGTFTPAKNSWFNRKPMTISVTVEGVDVVVDHFSEGAGETNANTRIRAPARAPQDLQIWIEKEALLSQIEKAVGIRDLEVGDPAFDEFFLIQTNDEELCFLWLDGKVRQAMLDAPEYTMSLKDRWVSSQRTGIETKAERLVSAVRSVALLAARGRATKGAWRRLARKLGVAAPDDEVLWGEDGSSVLRFEQEGLSFEVEVNRASPEGTDREGRIGTWVRAGCLGPGEAFLITRRTEPLAPNKEDSATEADALAEAYEISGPGAQAFSLACTDPMRAEILKLDPAILYCDGISVGLVLDGVELSHKRIKLALAIVEKLAAPVSTGPYR